MTFPSEDVANKLDKFQRFQIFLLFMVAFGTGVYALHLTFVLSNRLGMAEIVIQSQEQRIAELDRTADTHATPTRSGVDPKVAAQRALDAVGEDRVVNGKQEVK